MKKPSKLVLTDRLILDLTLLISKTISDRTEILNQATGRWKIQNCLVINTFGKNLYALYELQETVNLLRGQHKCNDSQELTNALNEFEGFSWSWTEGKIDVKERISEILAQI